MQAVNYNSSLLVLRDLMAKLEIPQSNVPLYIQMKGEISEMETLSLMKQLYPSAAAVSGLTF